MPQISPKVQRQTPQTEEPMFPTVRAQLPRILADQEKPRFNASHAKLNRNLALAGAIGAIGGQLSDTPFLASLGSGLAQGGALANQSLSQSHALQMKGYEDWLRQSEMFNARAGQREGELEYGAARDAERDEARHTRELEEIEERHQRRLTEDEESDRRRLERDEQMEAERQRGRGNLETARHRNRMTEIGARGAQARQTQAERPRTSDDDIDAAAIALEELDGEIETIERMLTEGRQTTNQYGEASRADLAPLDRRRALQLRTELVAEREARTAAARDKLRQRVHFGKQGREAAARQEPPREPSYRQVPPSRVPGGMEPGTPIPQTPSTGPGPGPDGEGSSRRPRINFQEEARRARGGADIEAEPPQLQGEERRSHRQKVADAVHQGGTAGRQAIEEAFRAGALTRSERDQLLRNLNAL